MVYECLWCGKIHKKEEKAWRCCRGRTNVKKVWICLNCGKTYETKREVTICKCDDRVEEREDEK